MKKIKTIIHSCPILSNNIGEFNNKIEELVNDGWEIKGTNSYLRGMYIEIYVLLQKEVA